MSWSWGRSQRGDYKKYYYYYYILNVILNI